MKFIIFNPLPPEAVPEEPLIKAPQKQSTDLPNMPMVWTDRSGTLSFVQDDLVTIVTIETEKRMERLQKPYFFSFLYQC
jgi:hypothetical protein